MIRGTSSQHGATALIPHQGERDRAPRANHPCRGVGPDECGLGEDPAVLTWRICLAPRPRLEPTGRHWWRELVTDAWRSAYHAWWLDREAVAIGYATEMREYEAEHPPPRLGDFMVHLSQGCADLYELNAARAAGGWSA